MLPFESPTITSHISVSLHSQALYPPSPFASYQLEATGKFI